MLEGFYADEKARLDLIEANSRCMVQPEGSKYKLGDLVTYTHIEEDGSWNQYEIKHKVVAKIIRVFKGTYASKSAFSYLLAYEFRKQPYDTWCGEEFLEPVFTA